MYVVLYVAGATRTQIYLTADQRKRLDELMRRENRTLADLVREALDAYLAEAAPDADAALSATFGSAPDAEVPPRGEWARG